MQSLLFSKEPRNLWQEVHVESVEESLFCRVVRIFNGSGQSFPVLSSVAYNLPSGIWVDVQRAAVFSFVFLNLFSLLTLQF
jgi:hypothetical protein